jgi:hypothetical protein
MYIFTTRFYVLSQVDRSQIVSAALSDLEESLSKTADKTEREKTVRKIRRIRRKAMEIGIFPERYHVGDLLSNVEEAVEVGYQITVGQFVAALLGFHPNMLVSFSNSNTLGQGLNQITTDQGVCFIHTAIGGKEPTVAELLVQLEGIPREMGVMLCGEGIVEPEAVTLPFEDEVGEEMWAIVTTFRGK